MVWFKHHLRSASRGACSYLPSFWCGGNRGARSERCGNWGVFLLIFVWIAGLCICLILVSAISLPPWFNRHASACQPDGSFQLDYENFRYWAKSGFFQISLGTGDLSFTQAKAIDITWDVVFGRGGQALLAFISWRVFAKYVTISMEVRPVTFDTYRTIFLQNESLIFAIPRMMHDFVCHLRLPSYAAMIFIITTMIFILAFPTFGSAMTGYSANVRPYIRNRDGNYIPFEAFRYTTYIINDGWRINKTAHFHVPYISTGDPLPNLGEYQRSAQWTKTDDDRWTKEDCGFIPEASRYDCYLLGNVSRYVGQHGFYGLTKESSNLIGLDLAPPALNITAVYLPKTLNGSSMWLIPGPLFEQKADSYYQNKEYIPGPRLDTFGNKSSMMWTWSNQTFDVGYIKTQGRCQTVENYQWGFSFMQLHLMIVFVFIWTIGILIMWLRSCRHIEREEQETWLTITKL